MKKRIISLALSAITSLTVCSLAVSAEENPSLKNSAVYDEITEIIESIDGAGKTKVMITLSETTEYIYATDDKDNRKQTDSSNDSNTQNDYVIIEKDNNDTGLLIKTIEPKVRGIAVVCEGGGNISVQNQIYSVVSAVLNINTSRISIAKLSLSEEIK